MRLCSIASGSSGNCIYVGSDATHLLVDVGISGKRTEAGLNSLGITGADLDGILITHEHADHISGLPGMLLTMGNAERKEPLLMIGPKGLERVVSALRVIAPELPFEIQFIELTEASQTIEFEDFKLEAFRVNHNVVCYGYNLVIDRIGKFQVEKAMALGLERTYWSKLQKGETVEVEGKVYTRDMVLGEARKGLKVTYTTDTRPTTSIVEHAKGADLFICEGMYGEPDKLQKAKEYKHMTFYEAAQMARDAQVKEMWLTHYSPSLLKPEEYMKDVKTIFPNSIAAKDGRTVELRFEED